MKKLVARHIRDKSLGLCPCTAIPICLQTRDSTEMAMHHVISHIQEAVENRLRYIWAFLDIEEASDSTSCDTQRLPNKMGLETHCSNGLALCWVAEKLQSSSREETLEGSVAKGHPQRGILLRLKCCLVAQSLRDLMERDVILCSYALSSAENSWLLSQSFISRFWVWNSGAIEIGHQSIHK